MFSSASNDLNYDGSASNNIDNVKNTKRHQRDSGGHQNANKRSQADYRDDDGDDDDEDEIRRMKRWEEEAWKEAKKIVNQSKKRWEVSERAVNEDSG